MAAGIGVVARDDHLVAFTDSNLVVAARAAVLLHRLVGLHVPDFDVGLHGTSTVGDVQELLVDRADGVATLTVNRPQRKNAITVEMWAQLVDIFDDIVERREDRVLVITGAADAFEGTLTDLFIPKK